MSDAKRRKMEGSSTTSLPTESTTTSLSILDLKCYICDLSWVIHSKTWWDGVQNFRNEKYCKKCYVAVVRLNTKPISDDPYDLRNWIQWCVPPQIFHCCSCPSVFEAHTLDDYDNGLVVAMVYVSYHIHRYCRECFINRVHNPQEGLSPFGCCKK